MTDELLFKRFIELAEKSYSQGIFLFTDFLGLSEQAVFAEARTRLSGIKYTAFGGAPGAERVMIRFGDGDELGYTVDFPILAVKCEPVSQKFADKLTHRDFLGAILNLGIERRELGDIIIRDNVGYIFMTENIAPYVISELHRIKHTDVRLSIADELPEGELYKTERRRVQANGERLDAIVAKVFSLSREAAQSLFSKKLIFNSGRLCESTSYIPKSGEVISVRGHGRFIYVGPTSTTRKGKLNVEVDLYI